MYSLNCNILILHIWKKIHNLSIQVDNAASIWGCIYEGSQCTLLQIPLSIFVLSSKYIIHQHSYWIKIHNTSTFILNPSHEIHFNLDSKHIKIVFKLNSKHKAFSYHKDLANWSTFVLVKFHRWFCPKLEYLVSKILFNLDIGFWVHVHDASNTQHCLTL
jgi:hypothetical protein